MFYIPKLCEDYLKSDSALNPLLAEGGYERISLLMWEKLLAHIDVTEGLINSNKLLFVLTTFKIFSIDIEAEYPRIYNRGMYQRKPGINNREISSFLENRFKSIAFMKKVRMLLWCIVLVVGNIQIFMKV